MVSRGAFKLTIMIFKTDQKERIPNYIRRDNLVVFDDLMEIVGKRIISSLPIEKKY